MFESCQGFLTAGASRWSLRFGRLAGAALCAVILVACGGSSGSGSALCAATLVACGSDSDDSAQTQDDPLASFKQQKLDWKDCDPEVIENAGDLAQLGQRAQCALMRVPLDYANPSEAELKIELLKVAAEQPLQKLGAIVLNPGGPGVDGLYLAPEISLKLAAAGPQESGLKEMSNRYDLVAFSPRGRGRHSPLSCELTEELAPENSVIVDSSPENLKNIQHNARLLAQACANTPLSKHIHTDATARDMDLLRGLLGEEKLNYIGYSYGTWLGAWYAGLFPERVGRMLFDSSMDITGRLEGTLTLQAMGEQRVFDEVMLPYAARHPEQFGLGNSVAALRNSLFALSARLKKAVIETLDVNSSADFKRNIFALAAALGLQDLLSQNPEANLSELHAAISASSAPVFQIPQVAQSAANLAYQLFSEDDGKEESQTDSVYWSVRCNDTGTVGTEQDWIDMGNDFAARYPFAGGVIAYNPCLYWSAAQNKKPALAAVNQAGPLLMLQSRYDAATPMEGAQKTLSALPNARMIVVEDEYQHMLFPYGEACVDKQVAEYFLNGKLPERSSSCAGKELGANDEEDDEDV